MSINNDIGFIISNSHTYSRLEELFSYLHRYSLGNQYVCFSYNNNIISNKLHIPILPITEAKFWNGKMFVFNLEAVDIVKNFTNVSDIFYYIDRDEWSDYIHLNYFDLKGVYEENTKIKVIASNHDIYHKYQKCWNKNPITIMDTLSYENFKNTVFSTK